MRLELQLKPFVSPFTWTEPRSVPHRGWDVVFRSPLLDNQILTGRRLFLRRDTRDSFQSHCDHQIFIPAESLCSQGGTEMLPLGSSRWPCDFSLSFFPSPELHFLPLSQLKSPPPLLIAPVTLMNPVSL